MIYIVSWCLLWRRNSQLNSVIRPQRPSGDIFPSTTWPGQHYINFSIRATLVSGIGLKVLNLGRFAYNFEKFGERKTTKYAIGSFLRCGIMWLMEWYRWMLHESIKTKRNAFPYLSKHASEAFSLIFTLSNHFTHFKTILKFLTLSIFFPLLGFSLLCYSLLVTSLLCSVTPRE